MYYSICKETHMKYTKNQIKAMNQMRMSKVVYRNMWKRDHILGYTSKGKRFYEINIADDIPCDDCKSVVLLHELGHQIYGHFDEVDLKKEMKDVKNIFESFGVPYYMIKKYGGPHSFINIAMDLYINSTFLTPRNCKTLLDKGFKICTIKDFGFEYQSNFRDYYSLMVDKLKKAIEEAEKNRKNFSNKKEENSEKEEDSEKEEEETEDCDDSRDDSEDYDDSTDDSEGCDDFKDDEDNEDDLSEDPYNDEGILDEIKEFVDSLMKDFIDTVSNIDSEVDEDIQNEIYNENYIGGNLCSEKDNIVSESDVENYIETQDLTEGYKSVEGLMGQEIIDRAIVECDKDTAIDKFLSSIVNFDMSYRPDPIRRHNTGTRKNDSNIMYSSIRRKNNIVKKKLGILIDCSCSMDSSSLVKAIKSLKDSMNSISQDSVVVAWDYGKKGEWKIKDIPDTMPQGYWTDLSRGVDYLNELNCDDIIIYSDMATDLKPFIDSVNDYSGNIYSIVVGVENYNILKSDIDGKKLLKRMNRYICIKKGENE